MGLAVTRGVRKTVYGPILPIDGGGCGGFVGSLVLAISRSYLFTMVRWWSILQLLNPNFYFLFHKSEQHLN